MTQARGIVQSAPMSALGAVITQTRKQPGSGAAAIFGFVVAALFGLSGAFTGLVAVAALAGFGGGDRQGAMGAAICGGFVTVILFALAAGIGYLSWRASKGRLGEMWALHERGLAHEDPRGKRTEIAFDEIDSVKCTPEKIFVKGVIPIAIPYARIVKNRAGASIILTGFNEARAMGDVVERETLGRMMPAAYERLARGEKLSFGSVLTLDPNGVRIQGIILSSTIPWNELEAIGSDGRGFLAIAHKGNFFAERSARLVDIPNSHLLRELVRQYTQGRI